jgi:proteic killer suppression protein
MIALRSLRKPSPRATRLVPARFSYRGSSWNAEGLNRPRPARGELHLTILHSNSAPLELAFDSKQLRTLCESAARAEAELGLEAADALKHRLADLRAAGSVDDLPVGHPRVAKQNDSKVMLVDFYRRHSLVFCVNHPKPPKMASGAIDWTRVSRIKILRIGQNDV